MQRRSRKKETKCANLKKVEQKIVKQKKAIKINNAIFIDNDNFRYLAYVIIIKIISVKRIIGANKLVM